MRLTASRASITSSGGAVLDAIQQEDPTLDLNFEETKTLTDDVSGNNLITFSRASSGTYVDSDGLIKTSPVNLLTYSDYSQVATSTSAALQGTAVAPDGTNTARAYKRISSGQNFVNKIDFNGVSGTDYTFSVWLRSTGTATNVRFVVGDPYALSPLQPISTTWQRYTFTKVNNPSNILRAYVELRDDNDVVELWGAQLEEGTTATTYIPTGATISGAPRFDHDFVTLQSLGLLIEESRTNDVSYSNDFTQWVRAGNPAPVLVPASGASPSGLNDATELTYPAISVANSFSIIFVRPGTSNNTEYVFSAYLKGTVGGETVYLMTTPNGSVYTSEEFTLTTSWERYSFTTTTLGSNSFFQIGVDLRDSNQSAQSAQTFSIWGAQVEEGSFPTSYIPTTGSTVTRSPDIATIEGNKFAKTNLLEYSERFDQSSWTVFSGGSAPSLTLTPN